MYLDQAKKAEIFGQYGKDTKDTGSVESQVALFTYRIQHLTEHLKKNHKDFGTARALTKMVGRIEKKSGQTNRIRRNAVCVFLCLLSV